METVILVTFKITGLASPPIQVASVHEPSRDHIYEKLEELAREHRLYGEIQFKKLLQEKGHKMYIYQIGDHKCMVLVEKLEKVIEFDKKTE